MQTDIAHFLAEASRSAPSADNSQPLDFSWDGRQFLVSFSQARGAGKLFGPQSHPTLLALGACLENIDDALAACSARGTWSIDETISESGMPYARLNIGDAGAPQCASSDAPLFNRHTNRFPYEKSAIPREVIAKVESVRRGSARVIVLDRTEEKKAMVDYIRIAAEARFSTKEIHQWMADSLRFTATDVACGEGLDIRTLYLPPGGRMFLRFIGEWARMNWLNRFGAFKALASFEAALLSGAPSLLCIVGKSAPASVIDAGRLLARLWTDLNAERIAVHPYYVLTDQLLRLQLGKVPMGMIRRIEGTSRGVAHLLKTTREESLQMVLRIGYPRHSPPRSQRLPLETVYTDLTRVQRPS